MTRSDAEMHRNWWYEHDKGWKAQRHVCYLYFHGSLNDCSCNAWSRKSNTMVCIIIRMCFQEIINNEVLIWQLLCQRFVFLTWVSVPNFISMLIKCTRFNEKYQEHFFSYRRRNFVVKIKFSNCGFVRWDEGMKWGMLKASRANWKLNRIWN